MACAHAAAARHQAIRNALARRTLVVGSTLWRTPPPPCFFLPRPAVTYDGLGHVAAIMSTWHEVDLSPGHACRTCNYGAAPTVTVTVDQAPTTVACYLRMDGHAAAGHAGAIAREGLWGRAPPEKLRAEFPSITETVPVGAMADASGRPAHQAAALSL